ncbi:alpha-L-fucosidase [Roseivirga sp. E12]|uniref:alpha-L-fucosidase n=1 Tax=Roseivirga sp. E12 TaxID=2819237 RepID=UPI001ABC0BC3|nr:alpha-L-fucosidase [Roseivirga sp. E12]MBO3699892.1 alpha-L-fucosidase [Roseivirga sp. E12]
MTAAIACEKAELPPAPIGPLPSPQQITWHEMEYYAFVHFNMNTFTDLEWGLGGESPSLFNPSELDTRQWARVAKEAGMKAIILTAKHHDGFCLWPSAFTEHSVKNSPWKDGKGDVIRELAAACKEYGLKMGLYLSPWDRNHSDYGSPEYLTYYRNQMQEILTNYGEVFEFWVDGANGGDGYYGGANETRNVDRTTYYDWDSTFALARSYQPEIVSFSDGGPEVRWVGNERGIASETNWALLKRADFAPGVADSKLLGTGQIDGTHWVAAECDVSIRPGWYYHESQDDQVKLLSHLLDIYYKSVGRNANLLLNLPVDRRGRVHENDVKALKELRKALDQTFAENVALQAKVIASNSRGKNFSPSLVTDAEKSTYWATEDDIIESWIELDFGKEIDLNRLVLQEHIALGQRVISFKVEAYVDGGYNEIARQSTIGYKRILRLPDTKTDKLKVTILDAKACPTISNIEVYMATTEPSYP